MADKAKKISELTTLASGGLANNDVFVVVDTSATETKKVAANSVATYINSLPNILTIATANGVQTSEADYEHYTNATHISLTSQVSLLGTNEDGSGVYFYLPPGANGQLIQLAFDGNGSAGNIGVWVDNGRYLSGVYSPGLMIPFGYNQNGTLVSALYINGAWNFNVNSWD
jgi:hypothetical protein